MWTSYHETYPETHQVSTTVMGLTFKQLEDVDGLIYSVGTFQFQNKMDKTQSIYPNVFIIDNQEVELQLSCRTLYIELVAR